MGPIEDFLKLPVPRYTSYPAISYWNNNVEINAWVNQLKNIMSEKVIDLYLHIPYCQALCWYCGCNRKITQNKSLGTKLVDSLLKEWSMYKNILGEIKVGSIHFGGGTPTFLNPSDLDRLLNVILGENNNAFKAIELDPRATTPEHIEILNRYKFNKVSLGIQDFAPEVQIAINRIQTPELVKNLLAKLDHDHLMEINFDLIYGLPAQSVKTMQNTLEVIKNLSPTSIAFYQYAHMPTKIKNQKAINESLLPSLSQREEIHQMGRKFLIENNYNEIGFDHFAKENSLLDKFQKQKKLKRNFMGYTHQIAPILLGLGPTAISHAGNMHVQNTKSIDDYTEQITQDFFAIDFGHLLSTEDLRIQKLVMNLMCNGEIDLKEIKPIHKNELNKLVQHNLGTIENNKYKIDQNARPYLRNIAALFDPYLDHRA